MVLYGNEARKKENTEIAYISLEVHGLQRLTLREAVNMLQITHLSNGRLPVSSAKRW